MGFSLHLTCLSAIASGALATSGHAQVSLLSQTFDGYGVGANIPVGAGQTFLSDSGAFPTRITNAATLFPAPSSASSVSGGDAGTNHMTFGVRASFSARTNPITSLYTAGPFSAIYDTNLPITGTGSVVLSLITAAAADENGGTGTFTAFQLTNAGAMTALGTG